MHDEDSPMIKQRYQDTPCNAPIVKARLKRARKYQAKGKYTLAENVCKQALAEAATVAGQNSPLVGMALLELMNIYDIQNRDDESNAAWEGIRAVLIAEKRKGI